MVRGGMRVLGVFPCVSSFTEVEHSGMAAEGGQDHSDAPAPDRAGTTVEGLPCDCVDAPAQRVKPAESEEERLLREQRDQQASASLQQPSKVCEKSRDDFDGARHKLQAALSRFEADQGTYSDAYRDAQTAFDKHCHPHALRYPGFVPDCELRRRASREAFLARWQGPETSVPLGSVWQGSAPVVVALFIDRSGMSHWKSSLRAFL
mmetsp:Transcript_45422/g.120453  ORF Transcript_45422/g.120453 Transcript_45422/m.120453 type:complete len:206 (-) Transcript_45422:1-618(-)